MLVLWEGSTRYFILDKTEFRDSLEKTKAKNEIDNLPEKQRKGVYDTIALERFRHSLSRREWNNAIHNLKINHVSFITFIRYILYLVDRVTGKKSYGFKAFKI